jgi:hypothetical protein
LTLSAMSINNFAAQKLMHGGKSKYQFLLFKTFVISPCFNRVKGARR